MALNLFDFTKLGGVSSMANRQLEQPTLVPGATGGGLYPPTPTRQTLPQTPAVVPKNTMQLFSDEKEANQRMLDAGLSQDQANELHKQRRNDLLGKISQEDAHALIKMRAAGLDTLTAIDLVKQKRQADLDNRPLWKKAGEGAVNFMAGNLDTVLKYGGNALDVATGGKAGFGEDVKAMTEQNKNLFDFNNNTAFRAGSYLPDVAASVAPMGGFLKTGGFIASGAKTGALFGGIQPLLDSGSDTKVSDVVSGAAYGGAIGAAGTTVGVGIQKGVKGIGKYISKTLPENLQVSGQFNRADLTNASERIAKLTGKEIDVNDASRWLLDRGVRGDLTTQRKMVQRIVQSNMNNADALLASKTGDIGASTEAIRLRNALGEKLDNYGSYTKEGKFIPSAGNEEQASKMLRLIRSPSMTLKEMNEGRHILADGLFNKQGTMKEVAAKEGWQNVWKDTSQFIESKAPGFRAINKNMEVGIAIDKALLKKETAEQTKQMLAYLGINGGAGGAIGYGMSGGDTETAIKGAAVGFGVGQLSRFLNSPSVKSKLAYYLNKLSPSARKAMQDIQKGVEIRPENIGAIVKEMKRLPPPSGKPLSANVVGVKPMRGTPNESALTSTVGKRPGTSRVEPKVPRPAPKLLPSGYAINKNGEKILLHPQKNAIIEESKKGLSSNIQRPNGRTILSSGILGNAPRDLKHNPSGTLIHPNVPANRSGNGGSVPARGPTSARNDNRNLTDVHSEGVSKKNIEPRRILRPNTAIIKKPEPKVTPQPTRGLVKRPEPKEIPNPIPRKSLITPPKPKVISAPVRKSFITPRKPETKADNPTPRKSFITPRKPNETPNTAPRKSFITPRKPEQKKPSPPIIKKTKK